MIRERQVVLFKFPQTNQATGKLRSALVIRKIPGRHDDWLICMISSQLSREVEDFDETITENDYDFMSSGLKQTSLIRSFWDALLICTFCGGRDELHGRRGDTNLARRSCGMEISSEEYRDQICMC